MSGMARLLGDPDTASEVPIAKAYLLSIWGKQMFLNLSAIAFFFLPPESLLLFYRIL